LTPMSLEKQVTIIYAVINGYLDDIPLEKVSAFETAFHKFMATTYASLINMIATKKELSAESEETLKKAILHFKQGLTL
jgi:F-type H+/Na+-transporting ATPase subunit alpha